MKAILLLVGLTAGIAAQTTKPTSSPISSLAAAPPAATGDSDCLADYVVARCLETETPKAQDCDFSDKECLCIAYSSISTCYNNCPKDPRSFSARRLASNYCMGVTTKAKPLPPATATDATQTATKGGIRAMATPSADRKEETGSAVRTTAGILLGYVGVVVAML
ncbi:hypothetical protein ACO1O0_002109 [Amphichorda felina]